MMNRSWWGVFSFVALLLTGCATAKSSKLGTAPPEVTTIFRDLTEASGRDSTSVIVSERRSPTLNAASAGGSRFIVTSGLVETGNRCLLIGVAAHELAHDTLGHVQAARSAQTGVNAAANIVGAFIPFGGVVVQLAAMPALQAYSRSQEADADREAMIILDRAGQPRWMLRYALDFLTRLQGEGGGGWLSSHPAREDRLAEQPAFDDRVTDVCGPDIEMDRQVAIARTRIFLANERGLAKESREDETARD